MPVILPTSRGGFKYGDIGRMAEADIPKLRAATELMASTLVGEFLDSPQEASIRRICAENRPGNRRTVPWRVTFAGLIVKESPPLALEALDFSQN